MTTVDHTQPMATLWAALDSAHTVMALSSQDWSVAEDFAWLYGILVGWDNDPDGGDVDQADTISELRRRFNWTDYDVDRLRALRAAVAAFDLNRAADLDAVTR